VGSMKYVLDESFGRPTATYSFYNSVNLVTSQRN